MRSSLNMIFLPVKTSNGRSSILGNACVNILTIFGAAIYSTESTEITSNFLLILWRLGIMHMTFVKELEVL